MQIKWPVVLKDALHNASSSNIKDEQDAAYGRGIVIGATAALMAVTGLAWSDAYPLIKEQFPGDIAESCLPDAWK